MDSFFHRFPVIPPNSVGDDNIRAKGDAHLNGVQHAALGVLRRRLIIKDMGRSGRDYLKVGQIMEILRVKCVRLIAINDGVDRINGDDDFTPFRNIMNDNLA